MEVAALARTLGALGIVLGLLAGALWLVRRYDISLPGRVGAGPAPGRRVTIVERVQLDARRSLVLLRRDDREHLVVLLPDGLALIESGIPPAKQDMVLCADLEGSWYAQ